MKLHDFVANTPQTLTSFLLKTMYFTEGLVKGLNAL